MKAAPTRSLFALMVIFALGACSSPPAATAPAGVTPLHNSSLDLSAAPGTVVAAGSRCALVTVAEVATAAGQSMKLLVDEGAQGICMFAAVTDGSLVVSVRFTDDGGDIKQIKAQLENLSEHLPGMGDDAYWNPTIGEVFVQKNTRAFRIDLPSLVNLTSTPAARKSKMVALANAVLARF